MKSQRIRLLLTVFMLAAFMSACAPKVQKQQLAETQQPSVTQQQPAQPTPTAKQSEPDYIKGAQNMKDVLKEMKEAISSKDYDKAVIVSKGLEENWKVIEDLVKLKSKDLYEKVEEPLDMINAAVKIKPFDEKTIGSDVEKLNNIMNEIIKLK
jgi:PBP1b-binding outer membrane lipoprotein LpoB